MHRSRLANVLLALGAAAIAPLGLQAQVRDVISKEISVGSSGASLVLEFAGGERLDIELTRGSVRIDDDPAGSYQPGGSLDTAWRALLAHAVTLDDDPLAEALANWSVPADVTGGAATVARTIDQALENAVNDTDVQANAAEPAVSVGNQASLVRLLLGLDGRLELLDDAVEDLEDAARIVVGENFVLGADETVAGNLLVIDGDARIEGTVNGDVVVLGGSLELLEGSAVTGSVRLADSRLVRNQIEVGGDVIEIDENALVGDDIREDIRREVIEEVRADLREEMRDEGGFSVWSPFRPIVRGVGGVLENLVTVLILGLIGAAVFAFGGERVDVIAETIRRAPGRSAAVGAAGAVLLIPVWVLGFIALVVSIVGIPVAIAWLPLFPIAACLAALVGYLGVARNAGEWLADSDLPWTHWIRKSNSLITMMGGLLGLTAMFVAANVVSIAPFLGFLTGLLVLAGVVMTIAAVQVGFGAVIISRGGRRRDYAKYSADEAWEAAMKVEVEEDVVEPEQAPEQDPNIGGARDA